MRLVKSEDVKNKTVLLRVDYNVPIDKERMIQDNSRIIKSIKTIEFLLSNNAKVIIISHFGRIKEKKDLEKYSMITPAKELCRLLNQEIDFINRTDFKEVKNIVKKSQLNLIVLENSRAYDIDNKLESNCNDELSKFYSELADVYINDAFGASHRKHASTYGVKKYLPSYYGFLIENEKENLESLINISKRPFTVFMGGAKVEDKLLLIKKMLEKCDYLCLGGGILNTFLKVNGFDIKNSLASDNPETLKEVKELLEKYPNKIILNENVIWSGDKIFDINIESYKEYINSSELLFINGTPGVFENKDFEKGTKSLLNIANKTSGRVIIGGGDTASAINYFNMENKFAFISSGGGASLEYIANGSLLALEE